MTAEERPVSFYKKDQNLKEAEGKRTTPLAIKYWKCPQLAFPVPAARRNDTCASTFDFERRATGPRPTAPHARQYAVAKTSRQIQYE